MDVINFITDFIQENTLFVVFIFMFIYYVYSNNYYSENFEKEDEDTITLILFFAPWCPHCKEVKPIFDELQKKYSGDKKVKISVVNGDEDKESIKSNNITSYPTILSKKNNLTTKHNGPRTKENFENIIKTNTNI